MEISSTARSRYGLPNVFTYLRNERGSKSGVVEGIK
jgi:hypothetical protein